MVAKHSTFYIRFKSKQLCQSLNVLIVVNIVNLIYLYGNNFKPGIPLLRNWRNKVLEKTASYVSNKWNKWNLGQQHRSILNNITVRQGTFANFQESAISTLSFTSILTVILANFGSNALQTSVFGVKTCHVWTIFLS